MAEIHLLKSRNQQQLITFVDVTKDFDAREHLVSCSAALESMHGQFADGTMIQGIAVFHAAYVRVGWHTLAWLLSVAILQPFFNRTYYHFAKHRHFIAKIIGKPLLWLSKQCTR